MNFGSLTLALGGRARGAVSHPLFNSALEIWRADDDGSGGPAFTALKGNYTATLTDNGASNITLGTLGGRTAVVADGAATAARFDLGSIASGDALGLASSSGATVVWRAAMNQWGTGTNSPRLIDVSDGGNAANGWAVWAAEGSEVNTLATDGTTSTLAPSTLSASGLFGVTVSWGSAPVFYEAGSSVYTGSTVLPTPPSATRNGALLNWNHSTDRMWNGEVEFIAVWTEELSASDMATINADPVGVLGL